MWHRLIGFDAWHDDEMMTLDLEHYGGYDYSDGCGYDDGGDYLMDGNWENCCSTYCYCD